jgi:hypothetical protein
MKGMQYRIVGQIHFFGCFQGRKFPNEVANQAKPLCRGQVTGINPSSGKIMEGVFTSGTPSATVLQPVMLSLIAPGAMPVIVFQAYFRQQFMRFGFIMNGIIISI